MMVTEINSKPSIISPSQRTIGMSYKIGKTVKREKKNKTRDNQID